jgi:hypothetical protein
MCIRGPPATRIGRGKRLFTTTTAQFKMLWRRVSQNQERSGAENAPRPLFEAGGNPLIAPKSSYHLTTTSTPRTVLRPFEKRRKGENPVRQRGQRTRGKKSTITRAHAGSASQGMSVVNTTFARPGDRAKSCTREADC